MTDDPAARLQDTLRSLYEEAGRGQPDVGAPYEAFRARIAALIAAGDEVTSERVNDLYLACACEVGDGPALNQFELHLMPAARGAIAKITSHDDTIDEAMQELRRRLFVGPPPRIAAYSGRGPLWKWLRITAIRTAHDVRRARGAEPAGGDDVIELLLKDEMDPELRLVRERYEGMFRDALRGALETLNDQERALLRMRYIQNQGIDQLAVPFRAHRATVARWLQGIREKILAHVHARLEAHIPRLSESEAHSLWRAVRSQVHLSFSRLVKDEDSAPR
jgi:RNA polymerase sigma-70 factor (ECF subfamily)